MNKQGFKLWELSKVVIKKDESYTTVSQKEVLRRNIKREER